MIFVVMIVEKLKDLNRLTDSENAIMTPYKSN